MKISPNIRRRALGLVAACALVLPGLALAQAAGEPVIVTLETNQGNIVLELDAVAAPKSTANFVQYVKDGYYDGTIFHRVIAGFMIQGGGFARDLSRKQTRAPIAPESRNGLKNVRGAIAMARTSDPNSATAQFFIDVVDNAQLDYPSFDGTGYTVFGKVIEGMDAVDRIRAIPTASRGMEFQNLPTEAAVITHAKLGR